MEAVDRDAIQSYRYALLVLKAPFPEGEAVIATSAEWSYKYALDILKAPFPLGEAVIAKSAEHSYGYAKNVLKIFCIFQNEHHQHILLYY